MIVALEKTIDLKTRQVNDISKRNRFDKISGNSLYQETVGWYFLLSRHWFSGTPLTFYWSYFKTIKKLKTLNMSSLYHNYAVLGILPGRSAKSQHAMQLQFSWLLYFGIDRDVITKWCYHHNEGKHSNVFILFVSLSHADFKWNIFWHFVW